MLNTYLVKKRDAYKIFRWGMKISWEPGSQVSPHYPTLPHPLTQSLPLPQCIPLLWNYVLFWFRHLVFSWKGFHYDIKFVHAFPSNTSNKIVAKIIGGDPHQSF